MKVLAISASPRRNGNSETLLDRAVAGMTKKGIFIKKAVLVNMDIHPCTGCLACSKTGECVIKDDMQPLYEDLLAADILIVASPIYFKGVACQMKCVIDRCQALWARKYILKRKNQRTKERKNKKAAAILVCASSGVKDMFTGAVITLKAWFATLDMSNKNIFIAQGLEEEADALKNKRLLKKAVVFGKTLID